MNWPSVFFLRIVERNKKVDTENRFIGNYIVVLLYQKYRTFTYPFRWILKASNSSSPNRVNIYKRLKRLYSARYMQEK